MGRCQRRGVGADAAAALATFMVMAMDFVVGPTTALAIHPVVALVAVNMAAMLAVMLRTTALLFLLGLLLDERIATALAGLEAFDLDATALLAAVHMSRMVLFVSFAAHRSSP